jgi:hypothetical protein
MTQEVQGPDVLAKLIYSDFQSYGQIQEDGLSYLTEVTVSLNNFRVVLRPNEGQHRGRPHCLIEMGEDSATFDIMTGELLAGTLKSWNRTAEKTILRHSAKLKEVWDQTRPDDQKLKTAPSAPQ